MSRRLLMTIHLYLAAFFAPALILVAISGGLYLAGKGGHINTVPVPVPAGTALDFQSPTLDADVRTLLKSLDLRTNYSYLKIRGTTLQTRPTSRKYYQISQTKTGLKITDNDPNMQAAMMELHQGHGPKIYKLYQKFLAAGLIFIVLSGLWLGLTSPVLRKKSLVTTGIGLVVFILFALIL